MARYQVPAGRIVKGWTVRLDPSPGQAARFRRDCGARRFACNWAVAQINRSFEAGRQGGDYDTDVWSAYGLRKRWNQAKAEVAPWWAECSKEAYSDGLAAAAAALGNWQASRTGKRPGPGMGFPRFRKKATDPLRCTYTTGALRVDGSRVVVLPGAGRVRTAENIRPVWRHVRRGTGRLLSATIGERNGRWLVSLRLEITPPCRPDPRADTVGVDVGIGADLLIVMGPGGSVVEKVPNPRALRASLAGLRTANRELARKQQGSPRWVQARRRLGRAHAQVAAIRLDTLHKATTRLAKTHGQVVIEDLAVRPLTRGLRCHRKSWIDASAGEMRRQLAYKTAWYGSELVVADRWFPSSKQCSRCRAVNQDLALSDRDWNCPACGARHDRDENAGTNLANYPASQAEAQSGRKTGLARQSAPKRVNHLGKVAA